MSKEESGNIVLEQCLRNFENSGYNSGETKENSKEESRDIEFEQCLKTLNTAMN